MDKTVHDNIHFWNVFSNVLQLVQQTKITSHFEEGSNIN